MPSQVPVSELAITQLSGVGPKLALNLREMGIETLLDLLFHLPFRYQNRTRITPIGAARAGADLVIEGRVVLADIVPGRRRSLLARIEDGTGMLSARFYYFNASQKQQLQAGRFIRCMGELRRGATGLEFYHPEYRVSDAPLPPLEQSLTPVYPLSEGITQARLRKLIGQVLDRLSGQALPELLPPLPGKTPARDISAVLEFLHRPPVAKLGSEEITLLEQGRHPAQARLAFEELVAHHLSLFELRRRTTCCRAPALPPADGLRESFLTQLPFQLTGAQLRVADEIKADLARGQPMLRLVQGDVGSGKTLVAVLAALQAVAQGYQVAVMAPTEILAEQHRDNFRAWLEPLGIGIAWLSGKLTARQRREELALVAEANAGIVIGTHALFQKEVAFARLGLVIIDEQHRFGVHQRLALQEKGHSGKLVPHQLIMTATPIPRTLAMCAYADLDISVIDELPPGRTPVETLVTSDKRRAEVMTRVQEMCSQGSQAYWVCTQIEESEVMQCQAAEETARMLREQLPAMRIGLVHGRMKSPEKAAVMAAFKAGGIDLLVATTVVEVGVDVANASLMIIENPERLGLAQLHQLRGRVGRGRKRSFCVLMYQAPLSRQAKERLATMRDTNDGFLIAEKDLELRGPGEVLGTKQSGMLQFRIADFERDQSLFPAARDCAARILREFPNHSAPLIQRWLGSKPRYGQV